MVFAFLQYFSHFFKNFCVYALTSTKKHGILYLRKRKPSKESDEPMGINAAGLDIALIKNNKSKDDLANELGINVATLYRKINGNSDFYRDEIKRVSLFLNLDAKERELIFFN